MVNKVIIPPTLEPVTVEEVRSVMGINQAGDVSRDEIIKARIISARMWCEWYTKYKFMRQTVNYYGCGFGNCCVELLSPLVSVTSIKYIDINGLEQTLANTEYLVDTVSNRVLPAYGKTWPETRLQPNSITIEYLVGVETRDEVDQRVKDSITWIVGQWERFQNSFEGGGYPPDFPNLTKSLLSEFVDMRGIL